MSVELLWVGYKRDVSNRLHASIVVKVSKPDGKTELTVYYSYLKTGFVRKKYVKYFSYDKILGNANMMFAVMTESAVSNEINKGYKPISVESLIKSSPDVIDNIKKEELMKVLKNEI